MFIRIILSKSPFHFGGCKIRLIFLIIKIMAKDFFGKVIDQTIYVRLGRGIL